MLFIHLWNLLFLFYHSSSCIQQGNNQISPLFPDKLELHFGILLFEQSFQRNTHTAYNILSLFFQSGFFHLWYSLYNVNNDNTYFEETLLQRRKFRGIIHKSSPHFILTCPLKSLPSWYCRGFVLSRI